MSTVGLTVTSYVVLGLIALRGPSTSYDLKRASGHSIGYFWPFPHAQLYSEPRRLVEAGLLTVEQESEGRRKQTFSLTEDGRAELGRWLDEPISEPMQIRDVGELKLFFGELISAGSRRQLAEGQIRQHRERLAEYHAIEARFGEREDVAARLVPLRLGMAMTQAAVTFWEDFLEAVDGA